jgi:hypothetical protein
VAPGERRCPASLFLEGYLIGMSRVKRPYEQRHKYYKKAGRPAYSQAKSAVELHADYEIILSQLVKGTSVTDLARRFDLTHAALSHYKRTLKRKHPDWFTRAAADDWGASSPEELAKLREETAAGWLNAVRGHLRKLTLRLDANIASGHDNTAVRWSSEISKILEMLGKSVSELSNIGTVNVAVTTNNLILSPAYHNLRTVLLDALRKHPDARVDVLAALQSIEGDDEAAPKVPPLKLVGGSHE